MPLRPTIIVLAAGRGSRFRGDRGADAVPAEPGPAAAAGEPAAGHKLAQPLHGSTVLGLTLRHAVESQLPVLVVTTAALAPLAARQLARRDVLVLDDDTAAQGMGHSIAIGVAERSGATGWLVLPGDLPLVRPGTLRAVAAALEQHHPVVFAEHGGRRGHPVGFAAELYSELIRLQGDEGARRVVARYPSVGVAVDDPGVLADVDTPADLAALRRLQAAAVGAGGIPAR